MQLNCRSRHFAGSLDKLVKTVRTDNRFCFLIRNFRFDTGIVRCSQMRLGLWSPAQCMNDFVLVIIQLSSVMMCTTYHR